MKIKYTLNFPQINKNKYNITIGAFDALHIGHQKLLKTLIRESAQDNVKSCLITFTNRPKHFLNNRHDGIILSNEDRLEYFHHFGIDLVILLTFDRKIAHLSAEKFIKIINSRLSINKIIIGSDFKFGYRGQGNITLLQKIQKNFNYQIIVVKVKRHFFFKISTTRIKFYLNSGKIEKANQLLGYPFFIKGKVIKGKGNGRRIGFPTVNLLLSEPGLLLPHPGVYLTKIKYNNAIYDGMTYIGVNFVDHKFTIETHIIQFNDNIYNKKITVFFIKKLRNSIKFTKFEDLKIQLEKDYKKIIKFLKK